MSENKIKISIVVPVYNVERYLEQCLDSLINQTLKDIEIIEESLENNAGEILEIAKDYIVVACEKGSLKIGTLQAPSKNSISSVDYIKGQRLVLGNILN